MKISLRSHWVVFALVMFAGQFGCNDAPQQDDGAESGSTGISIHGGSDSTTITVDGVQYIVAGKTQNQNIHNDDVTFEDEDGRKYEIKGGEFLMNGERLGQFEKGDVVRLNRDGSMTVNDTPAEQ